MLFLCMDANFHLKNQMVSNYSQDPSLGTGWAYVVPHKPYESYVLSRASDADVSALFSWPILYPLMQSSLRLVLVSDYRR